MKAISKIAASILAAAMMTTAVSSVAFADEIVETESVLSTTQTVKLGDVNGDNVVTANDAFLVQSYIAGDRYATPYQVTCMDVNEDYIVDEVDLMTILNMSLHSSSPITKSKTLYTVPNNESRDYYRYDCSTSNVYAYTINQANSPITSMLNMNSINETVMRSDDNYDTSNTNVVRITNSTGVASAVIVAPHIIATAAHCVYDSDNNTFDSNVHVQVFASDGRYYTTENGYEEVINEPEITVAASHIHIPQLYATTSGGSKYNYDYALIYVEEDLSAYGTWSFGLPVNQVMTGANVNNNNKTVYVSGFRNYDNVRARYYSEGTITSFVNGSNGNYHNYRIRSDAGAYPGKSGGAMYRDLTYNNDTYKSLVGIVTGGNDKATSIQTGVEQYSWGVKINTTVARFYRQNSYLISGGVLL